MKQHIENNFSIVLILFLMAGMVLPGIDILPEVLVPIILAIIMFFSSSSLRLSELRDIKKIRSYFLYNS